MRLQKLNSVSNIHIGPSISFAAKQGHKINNYQFSEAPNNSSFHGGRGKESQIKPIYQSSVQH